MVFLKTKLLRIDLEGLGQKRAHIAKRFLTLTQADEIQDLGWIRERILHFPGEICIAVLADGDMIDVRNLRADCVQARLDATGHL